MNTKFSDNLADRIIARNEAEQRAEETGGPVVTQWGIDEVGFPIPNPVNVDAIVARIIMKHNTVFKIGNALFVDREKVQTNSNGMPNAATIIGLCGKPRIILWGTDNPDSAELWRQIKKLVNNDWPIIWHRLLEVAPQYDRKYIQIMDGYVWGVDEADLFATGDGYKLSNNKADKEEN